MKSKRKLCKRVLIISIIVYLVCKFASQQKALSAYKTQQNYYNEQIEARLEKKQLLSEKKNNINSEEYIEEIAREKLDMYLPNERVFIDTSK